MSRIKGNHEYADMFPMATPEELEDLTASVATVGLINPIVVTPDGLILDGRNRLEACKRAGVDPVFVERDGDDDDYKEFVIGVNTTGRRESMTVQIAAAATALILGHEKRKNGRWERNSIIQNSGLQGAAEKESMRCAGLVLDILGPPHLEAIRDGEATLHYKYEEARRIRDEREQAEERERQAAEEEKRAEEYAREYFATHTAAKQWLGENGPFDEGITQALDVYLAYHRAERAKEEERKRKQAEERRIKQERLDRFGRFIEAFVNNFSVGLDMLTNPERDEILANLRDDLRAEYLQIESTYLKGRN